MDPGRVKPLLLIDVDGVINVQARGVDVAWRTHDVLGPRDDRTYGLVMNPVYGEWLRDLADVFELVWATTWGPVVGERIAPLLGLPADLPLVPLPDPLLGEVDGELSPKTEHVRRWAQGRALAWLDDDVTSRDTAWLTDPDANDSPPVAAALALPVDRSIGLTRQHVERLRAWAGGLADSGSTAHSYRVKWSAEDGEYVATVDRFPSLSWLAPTAEGATQGLKALVAQVQEDLAGEGGVALPPEGLERARANRAAGYPAAQGKPTRRTPVRQVPDAFVQALRDGEARLGEVQHDEEPNLGEVWRARAEREQDGAALTSEEAALLRDAAESPTVRRARQRRGDVTLPKVRAVIGPDGHGWGVFLPGLPLAAEGATRDEALAAMVETLRAYAEAWDQGLHAAPNHAHNVDLVRWMQTSPDEALRAWLDGA